MARARKNILLYCQNEVRLSITRFVLHNVSWSSGFQYVGYRVHSAQTQEEAVRLIASSPEGFFDAAMSIHCHLRDAGASVAEYTTSRGIPTVFVTEGDKLKKSWENSSAAVSLPPNQKPCEWIGRIKVITSRKRVSAARSLMAMPKFTMPELRVS